jgi:proteasome lid subunit RPN8/RPN11
VTEFPAYNGATLHIPYDVWRKIKLLTDEIPTEYMAYLLRDAENYLETENPFVVDDIFVPEQAVSGGFVDMTEEDFDTLNAYCMENKVFAIGNIHSHVNFGVGPSGTDLHENIERQLQQPGIFGYENGFMITLIINKSGDLSARLDVLVDTKQKWWKKPVATFKMTTEVDVPSDEDITNWVEQQKTKLRPLEHIHTRGVGHSPRRPRTNKGLAPVIYLNQQCEGGRKNAITKRWKVIRELIGHGWTVAMDTRIYGNYQALIVTRACGNDDMEVPFIEKEQIETMKQAASQKKKMVLRTLNEGSGVFLDPMYPKHLYYYTDEKGPAKNSQCARLVFENEERWMPEKNLSVMYDKHKNDYPEEIAKVIEETAADTDYNDYDYAGYM